MFLRSKGEPERFRRYPYGPGGSRLIAPAIAIVVGIVIAIVGVIDLVGRGDGVVVLLGGSALTGLGVAVLFLARWMARRRI